MAKKPELLIKACTITAMPRTFSDPMPKVIVTFTDDTVKELFSYYPDEISFRSNEFVGLTEDQARNLRFQRDKQYLQL